jgi:hypothetical protein
MTAVAADKRSESKVWLMGQGMDRNMIEYMIENRGPKVQWYKADGAPLPALLPSDAHHRDRYRAKGWTLVQNPDYQPSVVAEEPVEALVEIPPTGRVDTTNSTNGTHIHEYAKALGSPCRHQGCARVRTTEFKPRAKKRR